MLKYKYALIGAALLLLVIFIYSSKDSESTEVLVETTSTPRTVSLFNIADDQGTAVRTADGLSCTITSAE